MNWFKRKLPALHSDPIGGICRLLVERPWEWTAAESTPNDDSAVGPELTHVSGVSLIWDFDVTLDRAEVWMSCASGKNALSIQQPRADAQRLFKAIQGHAAAKVSRPRANYDETTKAMARAVLEDDKLAAEMLADVVMELKGGTPTQQGGGER